MLNPLLLLLLPLAAIPVAFHLITRKKLQRVKLSTFRFLMEGYVQQRRHIKLVEWMLMALRILIVALLVFVFSRPVITPPGSLLSFAGAGRDVVIVLDGSAGMSLRTGGTSSFERGLRAAGTLIDQLRAEDHFTLIALYDQPEVRHSGFATNKSEARLKLSEIRPGAGNADIARALELIAANKPHGPRLIYLISDMQKHSWASVHDSSAARHLGNETRVVVMDVGPTEAIANAGLVGNQPTDLRAIMGLPISVTFTLVNSRANPLDTHVAVILDDTQAASIPVQLQPGASLTKSVTLTPARAGFIRGRFEIPAGDAFPDDDTLLFGFNVEPAIRVVIITPAPPTGASAEDRPALFIKAALESARKSPDASTEHRLSRAMTVETITPRQFNEAAIKQADVVLLANVVMDTHLGPLLRHFVAQGGGLMIFPGPATNPADYNLALLGAVADQPHSGLTLGTPIGNATDETAARAIAKIESAHPVLTSWIQPGGPDASDAPFAGSRFYRTLPIQFTKIAPSLDNQAPFPPVPLLRLSDGGTLLAEARLGRGKILAAGFPASPGWTNLPLQPVFVPLMLRSIAYLHRPPAVELPSTVTPRQPIPLRVTTRWPNSQMQAKDAQGLTTALPLMLAGDEQVGTFLQTNHKGYYTFTIPSGTPGVARAEVGTVINLAPQQSTFESLTQADLQRLLNPIEAIYMRTSAEDPLLNQKLTQRHEVWRILIIVMFAIVGLEFLLSTLSTGAPAGSASAATNLYQRLAAALGQLDLLRTKS